MAEEPVMPNDEELLHLRRAARRELEGEQVTIRTVPHNVVILSWVLPWASVRPVLTEWAPLLFERLNDQVGAYLAEDPDGAALMRRGELVTLEVGPYTAVILAWSMHWWLLQPENTKWGPDFLRPLVDQLVGIVDDPVVRGLIRRTMIP
ncbi:hypothetical protein GCM10027258_92830 [Amycolatopsis stemonae]